MSHHCPACGGRRVINVYRKPVRKCGGITYTDPREVIYTERCPMCSGSGQITCNACGDDGYVIDLLTPPSGPFDHYKPCPYCARGQMVAEQARIDADKAAWEAGLPDYDAIAHARIAAGVEPF